VCALEGEWGVVCAVEEDWEICVFIRRRLRGVVCAVERD
jgi:hypothetical protein